MSNQEEFNQKQFLSMAKHANELAQQIAKVSGEPVLSFEEFSKEHSQSRLAYTFSKEWVNALVLGIGLGSIIRSNTKGTWNLFKEQIVAAGSAGAVLYTVPLIFAPSQLERDVFAYGKYLNEKSSGAFEKATYAERVKMYGVGETGYIR